MIATASDTIGSSKSPRSTSGLRNPVTDPATMPKINSKKMDGKRRRQASYSAPIPRTMMLVKLINMCSAIEATSLHHTILQSAVLASFQ
jgi:hypothetical protein